MKKLNKEVTIVIVAIVMVALAFDIVAGLSLLSCSRLACEQVDNKLEYCKMSEGSEFSYIFTLDEVRDSDYQYETFMEYFFIAYGADSNDIINIEVNDEFNWFIVRCTHEMDSSIFNVFKF